MLRNRKDAPDLKAACRRGVTTAIGTRLARRRLFSRSSREARRPAVPRPRADPLRRRRPGRARPRPLARLALELLDLSGSSGWWAATANMRRAATRAPRRDGAIRRPIGYDARRFRIVSSAGGATPVIPRRIHRKLGVRHDRRRHPGSSFVRQFCLDLVEERANPIPINGTSIKVDAEGELTVV